MDDDGGNNILEFLKSQHNRCSPFSKINFHLKLDKTVLNRHLYRLQRLGKVHKLKQKPPVWQLSDSESEHIDIHNHFSQNISKEECQDKGSLAGGMPKRGRGRGNGRVNRPKNKNKKGGPLQPTLSGDKTQEIIKLLKHCQKPVSRTYIPKHIGSYATLEDVNKALKKLLDSKEIIEISPDMFALSMTVQCGEGECSNTHDNDLTAMDDAEYSSLGFTLNPSDMDVDDNYSDEEEDDDDDDDDDDESHFMKDKGWGLCFDESIEDNISSQEENLQNEHKLENHDGQNESKTEIQLPHGVDHQLSGEDGEHGKELSFKDQALLALSKCPVQTAVTFILVKKMNCDKTQLERALFELMQDKYISQTGNAWILTKQGDKYLSENGLKASIATTQVKRTQRAAKPSFTEPPQTPLSLLSSNAIFGAGVENLPAISIKPGAFQSDKSADSKIVHVSDPKTIKPLMNVDTSSFQNNSQTEKKEQSHNNNSLISLHKSDSSVLSASSMIRAGTSSVAPALVSGFSGQRMTEVKTTSSNFSFLGGNSTVASPFTGTGGGRGQILQKLGFEPKRPGLPPTPLEIAQREQSHHNTNDISSYSNSPSLSSSQHGQSSHSYSSPMNSKSGNTSSFPLSHSSSSSTQSAQSSHPFRSPMEIIQREQSQNTSNFFSNTIASVSQPVNPLTRTSQTMSSQSFQNHPTLPSHQPSLQTANSAANIGKPSAVPTSTSLLNSSLSNSLSISTESFSAVNKNPISALMEYAQSRHQQARIEIVSQKGPSHRPTFIIAVIIGDRIFPGIKASNKKDGRTEAADLALRMLLSEGQYNVNKEPSKSTTSVPNSNMTHFDKMAALSHQAFNQLIASIPEKFAGRKVIAALIMKKSHDDTGTVISVGSGNRCITGEQLSLEGNTVNDSHAEIITRRGFIRFLYKQLETYSPNESHEFFEKGSSGKLRIKSNFTFHLYISTAPCGDGALFSPRDAMSNQGPIDDVESHVHNPTFTNNVQGVLRTKMEGGEGTIPIESDFTVQTWDGIVRGERLRTMSCTDKICRWNVVGMQGALLTHFLEPVYLNSLTLGYLYDHGHLARAVCCRVGKGEISVNDQLPLGYSLNHPWLGRMTICEPQRETQKTKALSVNWCLGDERPEVVDGTTGRCYTGIERTFFSRVCKKELYTSFKSICSKFELKDLLQAKSYLDAKKMASDFQNAKNVMVKKFKENGYGIWVSKPMEEEMFTM